MKKQTLLVIALTCSTTVGYIALNAADKTPSKPAIAENPLTTKWQFDQQRQENIASIGEDEILKQYYLTNKPDFDDGTNKMFWSARLFKQHQFLKLNFPTNYIELGFRSDGIVVWRTPPEAK